MTPRTGRYGRLRQFWAIITHDDLALTEILSGLFLVALRGLLVLGAPKFVFINYEVASMLRQIHITENIWGSYLAGCGIVQVLLAGTRYTLYRVWVTIAILIGFSVMTVAFWTTGSFWEVPVSLTCMSVFYTYLLARVLADRKDQREREALVN
jgi:hypothetical protein